MAALTAFAACNDDSIDYSTWSHEELLATPGGVDYLIRTTGPIDYAAIEEELETVVCDCYNYFIYDARHGWTERREMNGSAWVSYYIIGDIVRRCVDWDSFFRTPEGEMTTCYYVDRKFTGDRLSAVLAGLDDDFGVTVKARIENTLIIESYDEDNRRWIHLFRLVNQREKWQEMFPYSLDELQPFYPNGLAVQQ